MDTKYAHREFSTFTPLAGGALRAARVEREESSILRAARAAPPAGAGQAFERQLSSLRATSVAGPSDVAVTVRPGDTLTSLVRAQWAARGGAPEALSPQQAHRMALQAARDNRLADPDRILPGQSLRLDLPSLQAAAGTLATRPASSVDLPEGPSSGLRPALRAAVAAAPPTPAASPASASVAAPPPIVRIDPLADSARLHPLLHQTLDRAVDLGYIPGAEREPVGQRIAALADKHGFTPDDFAKAVLMESDGLNPRASNGRCHGIIQFCSGPDRGAASAGYAQRPRDILGLSVLQQLDLVDRYFDDTKLRDFRGRDGRVRLDDLYLTILTPAARQERSLTAPLPIAGPQALDLHVKRERGSPITRSSILAGLNVNARQRLGQFVVADLALR